MLKDILPRRSSLFWRRLTLIGSCCCVMTARLTVQKTLWLHSPMTAYDIWARLVDWVCLAPGISCLRVREENTLLTWMQTTSWIVDASNCRFVLLRRIRRQGWSVVRLGSWISAVSFYVSAVSRLHMK